MEKVLPQLIIQAFHRPNTRIYKAVHGVVWALIVFSILLFGLEMYEGVNWDEGPIFVWLDWFILVIFALELVLRVASYEPPGLGLYKRSFAQRVGYHLWGRLLFMLQPMNLIDLLAVLAVWQPLRGLRALRLLRLLRTVGLFKYSSPAAGIAQAFRDNAVLYWIALSFFGLVTLVGGLSIYLVEAHDNKDIDTIGDGIWWALVTLTTVGFGDIAPKTALGRIIGGVLMVAGMFSLASFAGIVGNTLINSILSIREEQFRMSQNVNHIVVCGYDGGSRMFLDALTEEMRDSESQIVVFGPGQRPESMPSEMIWISGDPTKESELDKVKLDAAKAVIIVGMRSLLPAQADAQTILTVFTMRSYLKKNTGRLRRESPVYIVAEILDGENVEHATTAGASEVVESTRVGFSLLAHAIAVPGASEIMSRVVVAGSHNLYLGEISGDLEATPTFGLMAAKVKAESGILLLGIRRGDEDVLNPTDDAPLRKSDRLIYLGERPELG